MRKVASFALLVLLASASTATAQRWGRDRSPRDGACFYKDPNFRGDYFCIAAGDEFNRMPEEMNDKISSVKIFGRAEVIVFRDIRFDGRSSRFDGDVRNLKEEGWNDLISSIRVRTTGRGVFGGQSNGSFGRRPSDDPDRIVRRAYQDILEREPDANGMRLYRSRIIDEGWTESQIRESLRDSREYRERSRMTPQRAEDIVRRAYLSVLRREPDSGARGYVEKVFRERWTQQDVERELRRSPEYRNKG
jgi:hypothetical protein